MAKHDKVKKDQSVQVKDMSSGYDIKAGFKGTKPKLDAFKGKPANINIANEYICDDDDQKEYYLNKGYKAKLRNE